MQTGTSMPPARKRRTTETPSRSGIVTSRTMTAGGRCATASSASRPPAAVDTAKPSTRSARSRADRTDASSSTTRTWGSLWPVVMFPSLGSEVLERGLHLGLVELEALGERGGERVAHLLVLGLAGLAQLLEGGLDLVLGDPERLGERGRAVGLALVVVLREVVAQVLERLAQLRLGDPERLRERRPAVAATVVCLVERRPDLGDPDAEFPGQRGGQLGVVLLAVAAARASSNALRSAAVLTPSSFASPSSAGPKRVPPGWPGPPGPRPAPPGPPKPMPAVRVPELEL